MTPTPYANPQKKRRGLSRLWHATGYSLAGLRTAWSQAAFRQEVCAALVLVPTAFWLGQTWVQVVLLASTVLLILITELLNSAIETTIDRISPEWHDLSKGAKDLGSAAVLLSVVLCIGTWTMALLEHFGRG